jgi:hypothetical protein
MVFLEMDMIVIYLFDDHQVVLPSRNIDMMNEIDLIGKKVTLTLKDFFRRFGS